MSSTNKGTSFSDMDNTGNSPEDMLQAAMRLIAEGDGKATAGRGLMAYAVLRVLQDARERDPKSLADVLTLAKSDSEETNKVVNAILLKAAGAPRVKGEKTKLKPEAYQTVQTKREQVMKAKDLAFAITRLNDTHKGAKNAITFDTDNNAWMVPLTHIKDVVLKDVKIENPSALDKPRAVRRAKYYVQVNEDDSGEGVAITFENIVKAGAKPGSSAGRTTSTERRQIEGVVKAVGTLVGLPSVPPDLTDASKPDTKAYALCQWVVKNYRDTVFQLLQESDKAQPTQPAKAEPAKAQAVSTPSKARTAKNNTR